MTEPAALARGAAPDSTPPLPDPRYILRYGAIRSGRIFGRIPASSASGSAGLLGDGSVNITIPPVEQTPGIYRALPTGKGMWVLEWDDGQDRRVVDAGTVWNRGVEDSLTLGGAGMLALLNRRLLIPNVATSAIPTTAPIVFSGLDTGSIMRGIVALVMALPQGDLPIVLEAARAGTRTQSYLGVDLASAGQRITELAGQDPNTEFLIRPRFADGSTVLVSFDFLTGTEAAPQLTNTVPWRLNATTPGQQVVGAVRFNDSATDTDTTTFAAGRGADAAAVFRSTTDPSLTDGGWPRLDGVVENESTDPAVVQGYADGGNARRNRPARAVVVEVAASWWWVRGRIGDRAHLTANHPIVGLLDFTSRVTDVAWDVTSPWVSLTLADTLAEEGF